MTHVRATDRFGEDLFVASATAMATARLAVLRSVEARLAAKEAQRRTAERRSKMSMHPTEVSQGHDAEVIDIAAVREARQSPARARPRRPKR